MIGGTLLDLSLLRRLYLGTLESGLRTRPLWPRPRRMLSKVMTYLHQALQLETQPGTRVAGTDAAEKPGQSSAQSDALQFAGLLLGSAVEGHGSRVLMFCTASAGTPVWPLLQQTSLAIRQLRNSRVALVSLCGRKCASEELGGVELPADIGGPDWTVTGNAGQAVAHWRHSHGDGISTVPTVAFTDILDLIEPHFDFILVDAGAVPSSPQALMVASNCTGVILLVQPGITTTREVERSQMMLARARARLLGFAFVG